MRKLFAIILKSRYIQFQKYKSTDKVMKKGWINYTFGKYLLLTNTVTSGALMFVGDLASQEIENYHQQSAVIPEKQNHNRYDWERLGKHFDFNRHKLIFTKFFFISKGVMTIVGISRGPIYHYLYSN
jgi:protein Mpv17